MGIGEGCCSGGIEVCDLVLQDFLHVQGKFSEDKLFLKVINRYVLCAVSNQGQVV